MYAEGAEIDSSSLVRQAAESDPLLGEGEQPERAVKKPFYRARPLWLVPFAITAALTRGMTLAPRIEVFTQLSCNRLYGHDRRYNHTEASAFTSTVTPRTITLPEHDSDIITPLNFIYTLDPLGPPLYPALHTLNTLHHATSSNDTFIRVSGLPVDGFEGFEEDPRRIPSRRCLGDPAVQAGAARLQTIMTTTMGLLTALTTGWWGHFGERHGRTKVLAIATFGLFLTDLTFILVSTPSSPLAAHGHKLLILAPILEGALGGWSTLQSATSAYLSDCTSPGSRAQIFSRFAGVFYIGISVGPSLGTYFIQHPLWGSGSGGEGGRLSVTCVFWVAVFCSFVNFVLVLLVFPESLDKVRRQRAAAEHRNHHQAGKSPEVQVEDGVVQHVSTVSTTGREEGIVHAFLKPLKLFMPLTVYDGGVKRRDWSLTFLGGALLLTMLSSGLAQVKYLYAEHVYGWSVEQLSYYISFLSGSRAVFLLVLCPWIIAAFKPKTQPQPQVAANSTGKKLKPKPTKAHLAREISFDLLVTRCSLLVDIASNVFVTLGPMPKVHSLGASTSESQALFVFGTALSCLGSGVPPALHSVALCIKQIRALDPEADNEIQAPSDGGAGQLFGALAVLQTLGQMILGPMLFGLVYSSTVAAFPKAVFVTAGGLLVGAFVLALLVRGPVVARDAKKGKRRADDAERGRSRVSKDLRGGAVPTYGAVAGPSSR